MLSANSRPAMVAMVMFSVRVTSVNRRALEARFKMIKIRTGNDSAPRMKKILRSLTFLAEYLPEA